MQIETTTGLRHKIVLTSSTGKPMQLEASATDTVICSQIEVALVVDAEHRIRKMETAYKAVGANLRADGTIGHARRVAVGGNLNRLPVNIREAILSAADDLGVLGLREDLASILTPSQRAAIDAS